MKWLEHGTTRLHSMQFSASFKYGQALFKRRQRAHYLYYVSKRPWSNTSISHSWQRCHPTNMLSILWIMNSYNILSCVCYHTYMENPKPAQPESQSGPLCQKWPLSQCPAHLEATCSMTCFKAPVKMSAWESQASISFNFNLLVQAYSSAMFGLTLIGISSAIQSSFESTNMRTQCFQMRAGHKGRSKPPTSEMQWAQ